MMVAARGLGLRFEYRGPEGQEDWKFEGYIVPADPDCGIRRPYWEHERVLDEDGDERDPEELDAVWWQAVLAHADQRAADEWDDLRGSR